MSWFSWFIRQDKVQLFLKILLKAAIVVGGQVCQDAMNIVKKNVIAADSEDIPGYKKFEMVYKQSLSELGDPVGVMKYIIKIFIEAVVIDLKEKRGELFI